MRRLGLQSVLRGKLIKTTISDKAKSCPLARSTASSALSGPMRSGCRIQWPVQGRGNSSSFLAEPGGRGVGDAEVGELVQPPTVTGVHREYAACRSRSDLLSVTYRVDPSGMTHTKEPPEFPGRFMRVNRRTYVSLQPDI